MNSSEMADTIIALSKEFNKKEENENAVPFRECLDNTKDKFVAIKALIVPMFVLTIKRADELADAMEVRLFSIYRKRTNFRQNKWGFYDTYLVSIHVVLMFVRRCRCGGCQGKFKRDGCCADRHAGLFREARRWDANAGDVGCVCLLVQRRHGCEEYGSSCDGTFLRSFWHSADRQLLFVDGGGRRPGSCWHEWREVHDIRLGRRLCWYARAGRREAGSTRRGWCRSGVQGRPFPCRVERENGELFAAERRVRRDERSQRLRDESAPRLEQGRGGSSPRACRRRGQRPLCE